MSLSVDIGLADIKLSKRGLKALFNSGVKCAKALKLAYVTDKQEGITRKRIGEIFRYFLNGKAIKDKKILLRIKSLVIPPAWREVWIAPTEDGHLQVTGIDTKDRKQYIYHPLWNAARSKAKYAHMHEFGAALPSLRQRLEEDLNRDGLRAEKILAAAVGIIQATCIRVGSNLYEQLYGSYGLTTLKKKHVEIEGDTVKFTFRGKKGVHQDLTAQDEQLSTILRQCKTMPGSYLFQYYDESGKRRKLDSAMVNDYIKQISGGYFTAKDFRTWTGTLLAIESLKELGPASSQTAAKRNVVAALDMVASRLGNTRSVCKKYYVNPIVIDHYTNNTLERFFKKAPAACKNGLSPAEQILLQMLHKR